MALFNKYSKNILNSIFIFLDVQNLINNKNIYEKFQNFIETNHVLMKTIIKNIVLKQNNFFLFHPFILNSCKVINQHLFNHCLQRIQSYNWSIYMFSYSNEYYNKITKFFTVNECSKKFINEYTLINIYETNQSLKISNIIQKQNNIIIFNKQKVIENLNEFYQFKKWKDFIPKNVLQKWKFFIAGGSLLSYIYKKYYCKIKNEKYNISDIDLFICKKNNYGEYTTREYFFQGVKQFVKNQFI